jgi:O-antigen ligase
VTLAGRTAFVGALLVACAVLGATQTYALDTLGVAAGLGLPLAVVTAIAVFRDPIVGVILALLAVPLEVFAFSLGAAGLTGSELLLLLTAGVSVVRWAFAGRIPEVHSALKAVAVLCLLIALGFAVAEDTVIVTKILLMWSAFTIVAIQVSQASPADIRRILIALALAGGVVGAIAVANGGNQSLVAGGQIATNRAQGSFEQPNVLGFFLVMAVPAAVVMAMRGAWWIRIPMVLCAAAGLAGLMLSLSRTSLVGTILGLSLLCLWPPFRRLALLGLTALLLFSLLNMEALQQSQQVSVVAGRLGTLTRSNAVSDDPRYAIYRTAPEIIVRNPWLGVGAGNFSLASRPYGLYDQDGVPYDHAHNIALTVGAELGLAGLLVLLWIGVSVTRLTVRAIGSRGDPDTGPLGLAVAAAMVGVLMTNLGDYPPRTNVIAATFLVLVGILVALDRRARTAPA